MADLNANYDYTYCKHRHAVYLGIGSPDPRRNYARASLIWMAICIGLAVLFYGVVIALFFTVGGY